MCILKLCYLYTCREAQVITKDNDLPLFCKSAIRSDFCLYGKVCISFLLFAAACVHKSKATNLNVNKSLLRRADAAKLFLTFRGVALELDMQGETIR